MAENMLSVVKYDAGGVEIKLEPETVKNYLVRGNGKVTDQEVLFFIRTCQAQKLNPLVYGEVYQFEGEGGTHTEFIEGLMSTDMRKTADDLACYMKNCV